MLRPSNASRWVKCSASLTIAPKGPESSYGNAAEGSAAHWVADCILKSDPIGDIHPNGTVITPEIIGHTRVYTNEVQRVCAKTGCESNIEHTINIDRVHSECSGTPDAWAFDLRTKTIYLWDFKYGWGLVEVVDNWQLICYAIGLVDGICEEYGLTDRQVKVVMCVIQPRPFHADGHIRKIALGGEELRGPGNQLNFAAAQGLEGTPKTTTGAHCLHCRGRSVCPAARAVSLHAMDVTEYSDSEILSPGDLANEYEILKQAKDAIDLRFTGIEALMKARIKKGEVVPGWCIEEGSGVRKWNKSPAEIIILGQLMGVDFAKPRDVVTPLQALKMKGSSRGLIKGYVSMVRKSEKLIKFKKSASYIAFNKKEI